MNSRSSCLMAAAAALIVAVLALPAAVSAWPADPQSIIEFRRDEAALALQKKIMPVSPATLKGSKITPNYLNGFLSLGTGNDLVEGQNKLLKAWNSSAGIAGLIADDDTQAPVNLPERFKTDPLKKLVADLVVIYYATYQGVEGARRTYFRQVEFAQRANVTKHGIYGVTQNPFGGKQYTTPRPDNKKPPPFFNSWYGETDPTAGNGVTAYFGSYFDLSQGPLILSFPKIDDYFVITFYNAYGDVFHTLGTRVGTGKATRVLVVQDGAPASPAEKNFVSSDIVRVKGVDFQVLGRILGKQRVEDCKVEAAVPGKIATVPYWWGVDAAVYYVYNAVDPLYYWRIAALVLARNTQVGLTEPQKALLKELQFSDKGLDTTKLSDDQKTALIAAIPIATQGLSQSFFQIGPKEHGYWYTTTWNSIPGAYIQQNAAFYKGFWLANIIENAAYILQFVDSQARPLNGRYTYSMNFKTPPPTRGAFWSIQTMRLDQFAMADTADFLNTGAIDYVGYVYGAAFSNTPKAASGSGQTLVAASDGSFKLTLSAKPKPEGFKGNYVKVVANAPFYMVLRIYNPSQEVVINKYATPPVIRGK